MDGVRFDRWTRLFSLAGSRRTVLGAVAGVAVGAALGPHALGEAEARRRCKRVGATCKADSGRRCCSDKCGCVGILTNQTCTCRKAGCKAENQGCATNADCCVGVCGCVNGQNCTCRSGNCAGPTGACANTAACCQGTCVKDPPDAVLGQCQ